MASGSLVFSGDFMGEEAEEFGGMGADGTASVIGNVARKGVPCAALCAADLCPNGGSWEGMPGRSEGVADIRSAGAGRVTCAVADGISILICCRFSDSALPSRMGTVASETRGRWLGCASAKSLRASSTEI